MFVPAHMFVGTCVALDQLKYKRSKLFWLLMLILAAPLLHLVMDLAPHWDASNLGTDYLVMFSSAWWEAGIENLVGFAGVFLILRQFKLQANLRVWAFVMATWLPDLYTSFVLSGRLSNPHVLWFENVHWAVHRWWRVWYGEVPTFWPAVLGISVNVITVAAAGFYLYGKLLYHEHNIKYPSGFVTAVS